MLDLAIVLDVADGPEGGDARPESEDQAETPQFAAYWCNGRRALANNRLREFVGGARYFGVSKCGACLWPSSLAIHRSVLSKPIFATTPESATSTPVGYLEGWYVVPDHRRKGIGAALIDAAER